MNREYDGCSDDAFAKGDVLITAAPTSIEALGVCKNFIKKHYLTKDDVKLIKTTLQYKVIAKTDLCITQLHEGDTE
jgi:hypothetical protein